MSLNYQGLPVEVESVSNVTLSNSVDLGTVRIYNGAEYVYVYNAGVQSISTNMLAVMSANTGFSVTVSAVASYDIPVGVAANTNIGTAYYGWLMTKGFCSVINGQASTALAQGAVINATSSGKVIEATGALSAPAFGIVIQATGSAGVAYAYIRTFGS